MKINSMLSDVLASIFKKPATQPYPFIKVAPPERLRGKLIWESGRCTGCGLCAKECPSDAIEIQIIDRAAKRFVMRYDVDRCTFCAQCVQNCRFGCVKLSNIQWELAALSKEAFRVYYGNPSDIHTYLDKVRQTTPAPDTST